MWRFLAVLVVAGALFASAFAAAAALDVQGGSVQAGADGTLSCAASPVQVTAWAVNSATPPNNEGLDWATVTLTSSDAATCAGDDLVVRLHNTDGTYAYGGDYNGGAQAAGASNAPTSKIVSTLTNYKVAFHHDSNTAQRWFVPAAIIGTVEVWVGGPANAN